MSVGGMVLVVDSDSVSCARVCEELQQNGFQAIEAIDFDSAVRVAQDLIPDAIVINSAMGIAGSDGFELCRRYRTFTQAPIVFLTPNHDETEHLLGITVGADDYLMRSISSRLLAARLSMLLRSRQITASQSDIDDTVCCNDVRIEKSSRTVLVNSVPIALTRIEFDLLAVLAEKPRRVFTRDQLIESVWGSWYGSSAHLDVHMSRLRKKVLNAGGPRIGHAVRGIGFRYSE